MVRYTFLLVSRPLTQKLPIHRYCCPFLRCRHVRCDNRLSFSNPILIGSLRKEESLLSKNCLNSSSRPSYPDGVVTKIWIRT